jgi:hypothetical protein
MANRNDGFLMAQADSPDTAVAPWYLRLPKTIGWILVLLPFVIYIGNRFVHPNHHPLWPYSVSGYYYTHMRDVVVGTFGALAGLLVAYPGQDRVDRWITNVAAALAVLVIFFPTTPTRPPFYRGPTLPNHEQQVYGAFHMGFAVALFLTLAVITLRFTRTAADSNNTPAMEVQRTARQLWYSPPSPAGGRTPLERKRDAVYRVCARLILAAMALSGIAKILPFSITTRWHDVFFLESLAIICVGISWLVRGRAILAD